LIHSAAFVGTAELTGWAVPFEQQELGTWRRAIEVNLTSMFHLAQLFAPELSAADTASVIAVGSIYAKFAPDWSLYDGTPMGNPAAYSASKAGLLQLTRWLATTLPPSVRVNSISPGGVFRSQSPEFVSRYERKVPMGRMATEDDVARAILFLATPLSSYVTGQDLAVDGGWGV
jgi:NAD(P)-dependent dehydrogenase (short-subunit alcohol dehydrogenase family)